MFANCGRDAANSVVLSRLITAAFAVMANNKGVSKKSMMGQYGKTLKE